MMLTSSNNKQYELYRRNENDFFKVADYPIPKLPVIDDIVKLVKQSNLLPNLNKTAIIGVQHVLETTVTLFDGLIEFGIKPENMYFSGKCYSSAPEIEAQILKRGIKLMPAIKPRKPGDYAEVCRIGLENMWQVFSKDAETKNFDTIIILDEGGRCLEVMPKDIPLIYKVAAIEQARGGLYSKALEIVPFPLVEVASSAAKKVLEAPLIANAILTRVKDILIRMNFSKNLVFGVIGNGVIGHAVCDYLLSLGCKVMVYDQNQNTFTNIVNKNFYRVDSILEVILWSNVVLGCTGKDITEGVDIINLVKQDTTFISCTSEDKEFNSLLKEIAKSKNTINIDTLGDITCLSSNGSKIKILQGGFPINFNRKPWNVPANQIEVTQGLLLGGCIQAILNAKKLVGDGVTINKSTKHQSLNPYIQYFVANHWLSRHQDLQYAMKYKEIFKNIEWVKRNSGGVFFANELIEQSFKLEVNNCDFYPKAKL